MTRFPGVVDLRISIFILPFFSARGRISSGLDGFVVRCWKYSAEEIHPPRRVMHMIFDGRRRRICMCRSHSSIIFLSRSPRRVIAACTVARVQIQIVTRMRLGVQVYNLQDVKKESRS